MNHEKIINTILELLHQNGRRQKELTDFLGITQNAFTDWKSGRIKSYTKHLPRIAEFFGVTVDYLLGNEPASPAAPTENVVIYHRDGKTVTKMYKEENMFWEKFLEICSSRGESPNGVAKKIGIASCSVTSWKNGGKPRDSTLLKLASYFGITVDYLLGNEDPSVVENEGDALQERDTMYTSLNLAETIKKCAKSKGVTLVNMLAELNLGSNTMSNMRHGRMISADSLARIADYLDCSVDYLLGRTDDPDTHKPDTVTSEKKTKIIIKTEVHMLNRLRSAREGKHKTPAEVAEHLGISIDEYEKLENNEVALDAQTLDKLSIFFKMKADFLMGKPYRMTIPFKKWHKSVQEEYNRANPLLREYMEYKHGNLVYYDEDILDAPQAEVVPFDMYEEQLLENFRACDADGRINILNYSREERGLREKISQ